MTENSPLYDQMMAKAQAGPGPDPRLVCARCGGTLRTVSKNLTTKRREKFGAIHLLLTFFTCGLWLLVYLAWPRHKETIGVDRYTECDGCHDVTR